MRPGYIKLVALRPCRAKGGRRLSSGDEFILPAGAAKAYVRTGKAREVLMDSAPERKAETMINNPAVLAVAEMEANSPEAEEDVPAVTEGYQCGICGKKYKDERWLERHMDKVHLDE